MAHNQFSALTYEEFSNAYLGAIPPHQNVEASDDSDSDTDDDSDEETSDIDDNTSQSTTVTVVSHQNRARKNDATPIVRARPTPKNWTATGDVTSVKNQG